MLYQAGAKSVTILPFGVTQHKVTTTIRKTVKDANDDIYQLRLNHVTGEPFWVSNRVITKNFIKYVIIIFLNNISYRRFFIGCFITRG